MKDPALFKAKLVGISDNIGLVKAKIWKKVRKIYLCREEWTYKNV